MTIGEYIRLKRKEAGLTADELGRRIGKNRATIYRYENNSIEKLPSDVLAPLASALHVTPGDLIKRNEEAPASTPVYEIKILGKVVAGVPMEAIEDITGTIRITNLDAANGHYYGLRVEGQSMEPEMHESDLLIIHEQSYFDSGDICIVYVDGHEATVKKVVKSDDGLTLIGYNTIVYPPHFYPAKEVESLPVRVVGKVVEVRRQY